MNDDLKSGDQWGTWVAQLDGSSGKFYFWNTESNTTSWDRPTGFRPERDRGGNEVMQSATKLQAVFRGNAARKNSKMKMNSNDDIKSGDQWGKWVAQLDGSSGKFYFWNTETMLRLGIGPKVSNLNQIARKMKS